MHLSLVKKLEIWNSRLFSWLNTELISLACEVRTTDLPNGSSIYPTRQTLLKFNFFLFLILKFNKMFVFLDAISTLDAYLISKR